MSNHDLTPAALLDAAQAHALALAMYNAVSAQQQGAVVRQAATTMVCTAMLSLGVAETARGGTPASLPDGDAAANAAPPAPLAAALASVAEKLPPPTALAVDPTHAGMAYQAVAQAAAIAVQDAADYLRNIASIAATANGVALAQMLANPDYAEHYPAVVGAAEQLMVVAVANFAAMGTSAEQLLKDFPETA